MCDACTDSHGSVTHDTSRIWRLGTLKPTDPCSIIDYLRIALYSIGPRSRSKPSSPDPRQSPTIALAPSALTVAICRVAR
jgi:hypothetical protein